MKLQEYITDGRKDRRTDERTDRQTDDGSNIIPSQYIAWGIIIYTSYTIAYYTDFIKMGVLLTHKQSFQIEQIKSTLHHNNGHHPYLLLPCICNLSILV